MAFRVELGGSTQASGHRAPAPPAENTRQGQTVLPEGQRQICRLIFLFKWFDFGSITGSPEKVKLCHEIFGYDHVINYKNENIDDALSNLCPDGVNIYFDNTSGAISDIVMQHLAIAARVIICGTASIAQWTPLPQGPRVERILLTKRAKMQGFLLFDHMDTYSHYVSHLANLIREGKLQYREDISFGLESAPDAIASLYRGENMGKRLIRIH